MNKLLASIIRDKLCAKLDFIEVAAGLTQVAEKTDVSISNPEGQPQAVSFKRPISDDVLVTSTGDRICGHYYDVSPDSNAKSVMFFEDQGTNVIKRESTFIHYQSRLRCIIWFNEACFQEGVFAEAYVSNAIISALTGNPFNAKNFSRIFLAGATIPIIDMTIFAKYSFKDSVHQYLMHPFGLSVIDMQISYAINIGCLPSPTIKDPEECT